MRYWVYFARCRDSKLYTGATTDLERRIKEHNQSRRGAKYTAANQPVELACAWETESWSMALRLEAVLKRCSKAKKEELAEKPERIKELLAKKNIMVKEL